MIYLTEEEKQQLLFDWRYRGFSTLPLLTEDECDELNNELEILRKERQKTTKDGGEEWGDYDPFMYPHKLSEKFQKIFTHPKIIEATEFLLNGKIDGTQTWCYFKPPGQLGRDMHQNSFYTGCKHNEYLNITIALDNHDEENGAVWNYEGTHRLGILPIEVDEERVKTNPKNWRNERGKPCVMPEGHDFRKIQGNTRKGDMVLLHSHTVHGSEPNNSNRFRRSFLAGYSLKGAEFKKGGHMKRTPIDIYSIQSKYWNI